MVGSRRVERVANPGRVIRIDFYTAASPPKVTHKHSQLAPGSKRFDDDPASGLRCYSYRISLRPQHALSTDDTAAAGLVDTPANASTARH